MNNYINNNNSFVNIDGPISPISNLIKIVEKIIRLSSYLIKYNIISNKRKASTEYALLALIDKKNSSLDENRPSLRVFIDLSKAFDTVCHALLVESLASMGIRGKCIDQFDSNLFNRIHCMKIDDV